MLRSRMMMSDVTGRGRGGLSVHDDTDLFRIYDDDDHAYDAYDAHDDNHHNGHENNGGENRNVVFPPDQIMERLQVPQTMTTRTRTRQSEDDIREIVASGDAQRRRRLDTRIDPLHGDGNEHEEEEEGEGGGPPGPLLEEFRNDVETWMEVDNSIRNLQSMLRERRSFKNRLTEKITSFMRKYDLSNLDLGNAGVIRSRKSHVKVPISQRSIKDGIEAYFSNINNITMGMQLLDTVFNERQRIERVSLRRCLPPSSGVTARRN